MKSQPAGALRPTSVAKRRAILTAAETAFLASGYDRVTMDEIAEMSQVSKQTVYTHFGTKDRLFVELVTAMTTAAADEVSAALAAPDTRDEAVAVLEGMLVHQLGMVLSPRLMRLRRLVISEVPRFPDLARAVFENGVRRGISTIEQLLRELDERGWARVPDPAAAAEQLNWMVMGAPTNAAMFLGDEVVPTREAQVTHVRAAVGTFLLAYAPS